MHCVDVLRSDRLSSTRETEGKAVSKEIDYIVGYCIN